MDDKIYLRKLKHQDAAYEALCKRCGVCCGSEMSDPCSKLVKLGDGTYTCAAYENRHGPQLSVSGGMFVCVNIRDVIKAGAIYPNCPYFENL